MTLTSKREKQEKVRYEQKISETFIIHIFVARILVKLHRRCEFMDAQWCERINMYLHKA